jgi:hypothetical protein
MGQLQEVANRYFGAAEFHRQGNGDIHDHVKTLRLGCCGMMGGKILKNPGWLYGIAFFRGCCRGGFGDSLLVHRGSPVVIHVRLAHLLAPCCTTACGIAIGLEWVMYLLQQ